MLVTNIGHLYVHIYVKWWQGQCKGKLHPRTGHERPEGSRDIALLFL